MNPVRRSKTRVVWSLVGKSSTLERLAKRGVRTVKRRARRRVRKTSGAGFVEYSGKNFALVSSREEPEPKVGIYLKGACDVPSMFALAPLIRESVRGTVCIYREGIGAMDSRSDLLLQALRGVPEDHAAELVERFPQYADYFKPLAFDRTFALPGRPAAGEFPKTVMVLSVGPDLGRSAYRHRRYGYLVDPGGAWLTQPLEKILADPGAARWFKENFESVGRLSDAEFKQYFSQVVRLIEERVGAHVLVYNMLTVEPGSRVHSYRFVNAAHSSRRRAFHIALAELSAELDFHIMDVDRILKRTGIHQQVDFAHFTEEGLLPIAQEAKRILEELKVL